MADARWAAVNDAAACKHMVRGHKGWLTQTYKRVRGSITELEENPSSANRTALREAVTAMETKMLDIEAGYSRLMAIDAENVATYDKEIEEIGDTINVILAEVRRVFHTTEPQQQVAQDAAPEARPGTLLNREHLRPDTLTRDSNPAELATWIEEFRLYYSASGIDKVPLREQRGYFCRCLDKALAQVIRAEAVDTTTVFQEADLPGGVAAPPSCISILEKEFRHHYPMFQRRMDMIFLRQPGSEQNRDFARRLVEAADQSDLERLSRSEFLTMCMVTNTIDDGLRAELKKLREPDWAQVCIECDNFDRMNAKPKVTSSNATPIEARQVNQTSGKKGKKGGQRQADPVRQQNYLKLKGRCFNCGDPKHSKKDCTLPSSTKCSKCQKLGHLAKVCMNSGPLDIQPLAKARQVQDDDSSQRQIEYHPDASGQGAAVQAQANTIQHAYARVAQPGPAIYSANTIQHWAGDPNTSYARVARRSGTDPVQL